MAKRNVLIWGSEDAGKSTFAASLAAPIPQGEGKTPKPARWPRFVWVNLDKPGVGSVAWAFAPGSGGRLIEVEAGNWPKLAKALTDAAAWAKAGEIDALVCEGLSVYYSDDVGLAALENPDAVTAGGNATRGLYKAPKMRLGAITAGLRQVSAQAKNPDFLTVLTAHAKEIGEDHRPFPDMSRNAWKQIVRLCEVVLYLDRPVDKAPKLTHKRREDDLLLARINHPNARAYFDHINATKNEAAIAQMRTLPGLVALLEHGERQQIAAVQAANVSETA